LRETAQMLYILDGNHPFCGFPDHSTALSCAEKSGVPTPSQFLDILYGMRLSRKLKKFIANRDDSPDLFEIAKNIVELQKLEKEIERVISETGQVRHNATQKYKKLCRSEIDLQERLTKKTNKFIKSSKYSQYFQDNYVTIRDGRFVLPVKAEYKSRIRGIIHSSSSSGATIFLEPEELVELNNDWKVAEIERDREKMRILSALAKQVGKYSHSCRQNLGILIKLDVVYSRAEFARVTRGSCPKLTADGTVMLEEAKHPLLVLGGTNVIGNSLRIDERVGTLIISGANTGGKTVTLKMIGLFAMMVRTGIFIPAKAGGKIGFYPDIFADIGDQQELQESLSSFSGHLLMVSTIMSCAKPGSLILFDELINSTDPNQGAALAQSILKWLNKRKMKTVVTTHYPSLKILGQTEEGFENVSVVFDEKRLLPTYRLEFGVPGSSYAVTIAKRLGISDEVLVEAEKIMREEQPTFSETNTLMQLEAEHSKAEEKHQKIRAELLEIEKEKAEQKQVTESLRQEKEIFQKEKKRRIQNEVDSVRRQLMDVWESSKQQDKAGVEKGLSTIKKVEIKSCEAYLEPAKELHAGDCVFVPSLMREAVLLEDIGKKKRVKVQVRERVMSVDAGTLKEATSKAEAKLKKKRESKQEHRRLFILQDNESSLEHKYDLHGLRGADVEDCVLRYLDQAMLSGLDQVSLIHGHGAGVLKRLVRKILSNSPYVRYFYPGGPYEGGDGVTVVILK